MRDKVSIAGGVATIKGSNIVVDGERVCPLALQAQGVSDVDVEQGNGK